MTAQSSYNPEILIGSLPLVEREGQGPLLDHLEAGFVFQQLIDTGSALPDRDKEIAMSVLKQIQDSLKDRLDGQLYTMHETVLLGVIHRAVRQSMAQTAVDIAGPLADAQLIEELLSSMPETADDTRNDL